MGVLGYEDSGREISNCPVQHRQYDLFRGSVTMKTRISNVCITALILSASAIGQKAPDTKDILSLGNTELTLGLTRDVVISRLTEQNTITKFDNDENALLVRSKNPPYISGEVIFKSGKLVFAERD
jgi:hypothetical protein